MAHKNTTSTSLKSTTLGSALISALGVAQATPVLAQQWIAEDELMAELNHHLAQIAARHPEFTTATYPKVLQPFMVSESSGGGHYGLHVDNALMGTEKVARTDISCTIFLSDPDSYQGGELHINHQSCDLSFKLPAGDAVFYPSTTLHQVTPVTKGVRRAALRRIESYIRHADRREMLYDLNLARQQIMSEQGKTETFDRINKTYSNLLRTWADT